MDPLRNQAQRERDYKAVFNTPEGQRVLEDLKRRFVEASMTSVTGDGIAQALYTARRDGENRAVRFILQQLTEGKDND